MSDNGLIRIDNPTPIIGPLAPSQDTTPDQIATFYRQNSLPFVRHSPLPVQAAGASGAASKSISQTLASRAIYGVGRNLNQIAQSTSSQGVSTTINNNTNTITKILRNLPTTYTLTGSWTNPGNAIDNDTGTFASASSTTSNIVYLASLFTSFTSWFVVDTLSVTMWVTAVSGGGVLLEYSTDSGTSWTTLANITVAAAHQITYTANIPVTIPTQNVQVRITLPGSSTGGTGMLSAYSGTAANDAAVGAIAWTNPSNAIGNQSTLYAQASTLHNGTSEYLKLTNFGFAIPGGATINGIQAIVVHAGDYSDDHMGDYRYILDNSIKLYKAGTITGTDHSKPSNWGAQNPITYGGSTDLWGTTWAATDINNAGFGIGISVALSSGGTALTPYGRVYSAQITVYYTTSSGSSSASVSLYDIAQLVTLGS